MYINWDAEVLRKYIGDAGSSMVKNYPLSDMKRQGLDASEISGSEKLKPLLQLNEVKGITISRLHRLHFSSTPSSFKMAISCPQWQRASESEAQEGPFLSIFFFIWELRVKNIGN